MMRADEKKIVESNRKAKEDIINHEGKTALLSDWLNVVFIHFEVDAELLQKEIPFPLDLYEGKAYVSLVAFSLKRLRPGYGGKLTEVISSLVANHEYLNVRTYVRHGDERGIYFIDEWLSKRLCVAIGKAIYGLPYRYGDLRYQNDYKEAALSGFVSPSDLEGEVRYTAEIDPQSEFNYFQSNTLGEFLAERYVAYAGIGDKLRSFRVWHEPWTYVPIDVQIKKNTLLENIGDWGKGAKLMGAHYSPGVYDVWIGKPLHVENRGGDDGSFKLYKNA
jgi:uncharacterized protein YqjF (DUF2071 family)